MIEHSHHENDLSIVTSKTIPTIGLLTESLKSVYQSNIWLGAADMANRLGYSLICFAGGSLGRAWNEFEPQRNAVYNFIDKTQLKGIVIAGSLGNFISSSEFKEFYHQFIEMPLVCLGPEISSVPTVIVDNTHGMKELISHIVEVHSRKRIAFVRGPEGNQEAEERLRIFHEVLDEHGINTDPQLVVSGDFSRDAGIRAVNFLLENKLQFDALVAANDDMALGALKAFQEHNIRVPDDMLVVGFDDIEESSFSAPPLTTIKQPLYEMGGKAIEVIHNRIEGRKIEGNIVPASLVVRQSCGCFPHHKLDGSLFEKQGRQSNTGHLRSEIDKVIRGHLIRSNETIDDSLIIELAESFVGESATSLVHRFLPVINKTACKITSSGGDAIGLFHTLAVMRQFAEAVYEGHLPNTIEELLYNASIAIDDSATRSQANRRLLSERRATILRSAGQAIASAFDIEHLLEVIAIELVNLEIEGCYLSLYDRNGGERWLSRLNLTLAFSGGRKIPIDAENSSFSAPRLAPEGMMDVTDPRSFLIEPLFFREEQIGIIIFNVRRCRDGLTYEILQQHICSALKGALLMKKVQEQARDLEAANQQLQKHQDSEHAYLEAVKRERELGREIQTSYLPRDIPKLSGWEVVTSFQPAREISGDFYDIFTLPDGKLVMIICDVSGKDISAAFFMALIRTLIRVLAEQSLAGAGEPLDAVGLTNQYLINHHYGNSIRHMYATLFMALIDSQTNVVNYVNAGHKHATLITNKGEVRMRVDITGPAIGIVPEADFGQKSIVIGSEETLLLYTDGITEARSPAGILFSKKRLSEILSLPTVSAAEVIFRIENAIKGHTAGKQQSHDITMLGIRKAI